MDITLENAGLGERVVITKVKISSYYDPNSIDKETKPRKVKSFAQGQLCQQAVEQTV